MQVKILTALILGLLATTVVRAQWHSGNAEFMGTTVSVEIWNDDTVAAEAAITAVITEMRRIDALMNAKTADSELARVNAQAATEAIKISSELFVIIEKALHFSPVTRGAFDITYASVGFLFDYKQRVRPDKRKTRHALSMVDYRLVKLDRRHKTVRFLKDGVSIDLGGIAKGYAVDRAIKILEIRGVAHALVTAGGNTRVLGDRRGQPWLVTLRNPRGAPDDVLLQIPLIDTAISISGDYERYFEEDGVRFHHIINPRTGASPSDVRSVSVIGPDAIWTDALSTGLFVLGVEDGLAVIDGLPGYKAVIVDNKGHIHRPAGVARKHSKPPSRH